MYRYTKQVTVNIGIKFKISWIWWVWESNSWFIVYLYPTSSQGNDQGYSTLRKDFMVPICQVNFDFGGSRDPWTTVLYRCLYSYFTPRPKRKIRLLTFIFSLPWSKQNVCLLRKLEINIIEFSLPLQEPLRQEPRILT